MFPPELIDGLDSVKVSTPSPAGPEKKSELPSRSPRIEGFSKLNQRWSIGCGGDKPKLVTASGFDKEPQTERDWNQVPPD